MCSLHLCVISSLALHAIICSNLLITTATTLPTSPSQAKELPQPDDAKILSPMDVTKALLTDITATSPSPYSPPIQYSTGATSYDEKGFDEEDEEEVEKKEDEKPQKSFVPKKYDEQSGLKFGDRIDNPGKFNPIILKPKLRKLNQTLTTTRRPRISYASVLRTRKTEPFSNVTFVFRKAILSSNRTSPEIRQVSTRCRRKIINSE